MDLNQILSSVNYIANKELSGNTLSPQQYNDLLRLVNIEYLNFLIGLPADFRQGMPTSRVAYDVNSWDTTSLLPFKKTLGGRDYPLLSIDNQGIAVIPSDYYIVGAISYQDVIEDVPHLRQVEILKDNQQGRRGSKLIPPSHKYPICYFYDDYIKFFPEDLRFCEFTYIRTPRTPVYAYTIDANDNVVYDSANSVQLEYYESNHIDIIRLLLKYIGVNLKNPQLEQFINQQTRQGK